MTGKNNAQKGDRGCSSNSLLCTWPRISAAARTQEPYKEVWWWDLHSLLRTCVRRYIMMVVRQEPQIKSTMLMNEWMNENETREEEKRRIDVEGGSTYAHRMTTLQREFLSSPSLSLSLSRSAALFSLPKIFNKKKRRKTPIKHDQQHLISFRQLSHSTLRYSRELHWN